ncbi:PAS domain-containing protein [Halomicroarcula sp. GCM10025709]|uniref:PAS domain-containing protein n=1 Tax=Halomicroarcula sp. GCM10025709 TaxID=3252669 RepID=UPI00360EB84C
MTTTLSAYEVRHLEGAVPDATDICVVSAEAFPECRDRLREWKREQRPTMAPVLLLVPESVPDPWSRYGDSLGRALDGILTIPSSKRAIRARVDGLVAIRQYSLIASQRWKRLELYGRAMDNADIGISIADAQAEDEHLIYVNQGFVDITGYSLPDALGRNCRFLQGRGPTNRRWPRSGRQSTPGNRCRSSSATTGATARRSGTNWISCPSTTTQGR